MTELLTVEQVAQTLNVSVKFVYRHADDLGGYRLTSAHNSPLRFDPNAVTEWLQTRRLAPA